MADFDALILGAGPSGLGAALALARGGARPLVLERSDAVGGLMRSHRHGPFILDVGRKELYARFPEIDRLWTDTLGPDYRPYPHRVGSLYRGRILELSGRWRGPLRGIPPHWLAAGAAGLGLGLARAALRPPRTLEEHWHGRAGSVFARLLAQGYWEKFRGERLRDMPPPEAPSHSAGLIGQTVALARRGGVQSQEVWRHPARGSGQLFDRLAAQAVARGAHLRFGAEATALRPLPDGRMEVRASVGGVPHVFAARHVISGLSIEALWDLLPGGPPPAARALPDRAGLRQVLLVHLFLDREPRFPHAWLEVNDPALTCGRITNFAAFGGEMVPEGRGCLCVETFAGPDDAPDDAALAARAMSEVVRARLADPASIEGWRVMRFARTNAAASWREAQSDRRRLLQDALAAHPAIFHVNRPGADWATLAGLLAGEAVLRGDRREFDRRADPARRHIHAEGDGAPEGAAPEPVPA